MKMNRPFYLRLLADLNMLLIYLMLLIVVAAVAETGSRAELLFGAVGLLLFLSIALAHELTYRIRHIAGYILLGLVMTALMATVGAVLVSFFPYSRIIAGVAFGLLTFVCFISHAASRIRYGQMKREFLAIHGDEAEFVINPEDMNALFNTPQFYHLSLAVITYIAAIAKKDYPATLTITLLALAQIFVIFYFRYALAKLEFLVQNRRKANMPLGTMHRVHVSIGILAAVAILLFASPALIYHDEALLGFTLPDRTVESTGQDPVMQTPVAEDQPQTEMSMDEILAGEPTFEWPEWTKALGKILIAGLFLIVIYGVIVAIIRSIKSASRNFAEEEEDEIVFLDEDTEDERTSLDQGEREAYFSDRMKIRRRYKKAIKAGTKGNVDPSASPQELEQNAGLKDAELHEQYESVRYGKSN